MKIIGFLGKFPSRPSPSFSRFAWESWCRYRGIIPNLWEIKIQVSEILFHLPRFIHRQINCYVTTKQRVTNRCPKTDTFTHSPSIPSIAFYRHDKTRPAEKPDPFSKRLQFAMENCPFSAVIYHDFPVKTVTLW